MSKKVLYVIGNGFDLWHNLPTSYNEFYIIAKDLLDEFAQYGDIDQSEWNKFEESLGKYDWSYLFDSYNEIDATHDLFKPSEYFGLQDEITEVTERLCSSIKDRFHKWIADVNECSVPARIKFIENSDFLIFNYTNTLERVYGIKRGNINYIHGSVAEFDELILGHGISITIESEFDEDGNSNRTMATDAENAAKFPLHAFKKPVDDILNKNHKYFHSLFHNYIVVIGHSLNDIDMPYFRKIFSVNQEAKWIVTYYNDCERDLFKGKLINMGIDPGFITLSKISDVEKIINGL